MGSPGPRGRSMRDPSSTEYPRRGSGNSSERPSEHAVAAASTRLHGMSTSRPRRRRDLPPRNIHVSEHVVAAASTRLHGISTSRPRRRRDWPPRNIHVSEHVVATRLHGISTSRPRRRRDWQSRNIHVSEHVVAAASMRLLGISTSRPRRRRVSRSRINPRLRARRSRGVDAGPRYVHVSAAASPRLAFTDKSTSPSTS